MKNISLLLVICAALSSSIAYALGGGSRVGEVASKADSTFPFILLSILILIAVIGRLKK